MVHIITDTTSVLPQSFARNHNIPVIPQIVSFGEESFYEEQDIDRQTFLDRLKKSNDLPKTAAPPPELFSHEFERLAPSGGTILCIHPSAEVSGTVRSAEVASQDYPDADIRIIDTRTIGSPLGSLVMFAALQAAQGTTADQIETRLNHLIPRGRVYFLVSTLEYLAKGGRIGNAAALVGSMLQIKPILRLYDGRVDQYEKERTHKRALVRLIEIVQEQFQPHQESFLTIMHAGVPDQAKALAESFSTQLGLEEPPVFDVPPAIVTHGGPGILAAAFFVK